MFLDVFHSSPVTVNSISKPMSHFSSWVTYFFGLAFCIFWAVTIPYTRFLMGVHSLDQIVYGSSLGVWTGLFLHFYARDNVIRFIEKVNCMNQAKDKEVVEDEFNYSKKISSDSQSGPDLSIIAIKVQAQLDYHREGSNFSPKVVAIIALITHITFIAVSIVSYTIVNAKLGPDSPDIIKWKANFKAGGCEEMDMTNALQNGCLNGCGRITIALGFLLFFLFRHSVSPCLNGKYRIYNSFPTNGNIFVQVLQKFLIMSPGLLLFGLCTLLIKKEAVGNNQYVVLFTNGIIPSLMMTGYLSGGLYDWGVNYFFDKQ